MGVITAAVIISGGFSLAMTVPLLYPITNSYRGVFLIWSIPAVLATILWWLFVKEPPYEEKAVAPGNLSNLGKVLRNPALWLIAGILFMHNYFLYTWGGWLSLFLNGEGASPTLAAIITSVTFWVGTPTVILVAGFSRPGERKLFIWLSSIIIGLCVVWAFFVNIPMSWFLVIVAGIASTTRFSTILTLPVEIITKEQSGTASGLVISIGYFGAVIGPAVSGYILDVTGSFNLVFYILIVLSAATVFAGFMLKEQRVK
jgi:CP family cyanate transporter-like MFS transporter